MRERCVRFVPSAVEGLPEVTEVAVFTDRVKLLSEGRWVVIAYLDIAEWYRFGGVYRWLARHNLGVYDKPIVAERDKSQTPARSCFRFLATPRITLYMPDETPEGDTTFDHVRTMIDRGPFTTFDLG